MSPQSRAPVSEITTSRPGVQYRASNACSLNPCGDMSVDASIVVHKIMDSSLEVDTDVSPASSVLGKRAIESISSTESAVTSQPFLSSYGSAFLSGIFADIAEASSEGGDDVESNAQYPSSIGRLAKKSRPSTAGFKAHRQSFVALDSLGGETSVGLSPPSVISPRSHKSTIKIELFNDRVRELQNLAFPSLPGLPAAVSSSSCTTATSGSVVTPRDEADQDQESFGWFVATDDDGASNDDGADAPMFLPLAKPDLAFRVPLAAPIPPKENVDVEVQQALAADTIDDVLGDLF